MTPTIAEQNEPLSPLDTNNDWPCASACFKIGSIAAVRPLTEARSSHSPAEKLACAALLSVTQLLMVLAMSALAKDAPS